MGWEGDTQVEVLEQFADAQAAWGYERQVGAEIHRRQRQKDYNQQRDRKKEKAILDHRYIPPDELLPPVAVMRALWSARCTSQLAPSSLRF